MCLIFVGVLHPDLAVLQPVCLTHLLGCLSPHEKYLHPRIHLHRAWTFGKEILDLELGLDKVKRYLLLQYCKAVQNCAVSFLTLMLLVANLANLI